MSFERGGQSGDCLGGSPLHTLLPSGRWQDNQTPTLLILKLLLLGTALASVTLV